MIATGRMNIKRQTNDASLRLAGDAMQNESQVLDGKALEAIKRIVEGGHKAEIESGRDGLKVIEVKRRVAYASGGKRRDAAR